MKLGFFSDRLGDLCLDGLLVTTARVSLAPGALGLQFTLCDTRVDSTRNDFQ